MVTGALLTRTTAQTTDFSIPMNVALANTSSIFDAANTLQATTTAAKTFDNTSFKINVRGTDYPLLRLTDETSTSTIGTAPIKTAYVHNEYTAANGILTRNEVWSSDDESKKLRTQYTSRDVYGNVTGMTTSLPLDNASTKPLDRTVAYEYDLTGRFQTAMTNAIDQRSFNAYDPILGSLLTSKGIDGLITSYSYNANGRLTRKTFSDGSYETYAPAWETQYGARTSATTNYSTGGSSTSYFDILGRNIRSHTTAFDGSNIVTAKEYNGKGQLFKEYFPGKSSPSTHYVQHTYIEDGRLSTSVDSRGGTTSVAYEGLKTTITRPDNTTTSTEEYAFGKTKRNTDAKLNTVTYMYDSNGEPTSMTTTNTDGSPATTVTLTYNDGHRTSMSDPNAGTTSYSYDGFGQLLTQTDAKGNINNYTYNKIGQVLTRKLTTGTPSVGCSIEPVRTFTYAYNTTGAAINQTSTIADSYNKHTLAYTYDTQGRLSTSSETIDANKTFAHSYEYDNQGRPSTHTYPSGIKTQNEYNSYGYLSGFKRKDGTNDHYIYRTNAENAFGQTTQYTLGENKGTAKQTVVDLAYDIHQLPTNKTATANTIKVLDYNTQFNHRNGNLTYRRHGAAVAMQENFTYDNLDRLETVSKGALATATNLVTMSYKDNGNINTKSDISASTMAWAYHPTKPHALTQIDSPFEPQRINFQTFCYNALGKIQTATETNNGNTQKANHSASFAYGIDDQRTKMVYANLLTPAQNYTNYYSEDYDLTVTTTEEIGRTFIYSPDGLIAVYKTQTGGATPPSGAGGLLFYTHADHLGSVMAVTNEEGTLVETYSFDAWGNRRNLADWGMVATATPLSGAIGLSVMGARGYTGHEHLDQFGLINMNGRLYDPKVGRFLSPDPVLITNASQNFNGYSYCLNNPLKYTDPSGEYVIIDDIIAAVVGGTLNLISAALAGKVHNFGEGLGYFAAGAAGGVVTLYAGPVVGFAVTAGLNVGFDFVTGNAYKTYGDPSSGINGWTIAFSVLDGFNAVTGGQAGQFARVAIKDALAQTFKAQLNAYTKALMNSAVAKWAATKQFIKKIFVKSPKKQIALKAVENSEVREVVEKGAKGSSVGVEAGTAEFLETGHKISINSNGAVSAKNLSELPFDELQLHVKQYSTQMNAFFNSKGTIIPATKDGLVSYRELAVRMINKTGGAYQRVTEKMKLFHLERIEMIEKALRKF